MLRILPLLFSLTFTACSTCSGSESSSPESAVRAYFSALERNDCDAVAAAAGGDLAKRLHAAGCDAALNDYRKHGLRLVRIEDVKPDGRHDNVMLARTIVLRDGKEAEVILRVEKENGQWKLASL